MGGQLGRARARARARAVATHDIPGLLGNYDTIIDNNYVHTQCGKNVLYMSTCIHVHACTVHAYTCIHVLYILS